MRVALTAGFPGNARRCPTFSALNARSGPGQSLPQNRCHRYTSPSIAPVAVGCGREADLQIRCVPRGEGASSSPASPRPDRVERCPASAPMSPQYRTRLRETRCGDEVRRTGWASHRLSGSGRKLPHEKFAAIERQLLIRRSRSPASTVERPDFLRLAIRLRYGCARPPGALPSTCGSVTLNSIFASCSGALPTLRRNGSQRGSA